MSAWNATHRGVGGAPVPATGGSAVRGHAAVGHAVTDRVVPAMPPHLATLHNPICSWDSGTRWHRAFPPMSFTRRSNEPTLEKLGLPSEHEELPDMCLSPCVTDGRLRYVVRPTNEVNPSTYRAEPRGFGTLRDGFDTPKYLYTTQKLPVLPGASPRDDTDRAGPVPPGYSPRDAAPLAAPRATPLLTPARRKPTGMWKTMAMEQHEQVMGAKAHW